MSLDAAQIGGNEHVGADGRVLGAGAHLLEDRGHRLVEGLVGYPHLVGQGDFEPFQHFCPPR